jgi:choline-glycine betaine transporter
MIIVFVFGLAAISVLLGVMKAVLNLNEGAILGFAALSFFIMMVCWSDASTSLNNPTRRRYQNSRQMNSMRPRNDFLLNPQVSRIRPRERLIRSTPTEDE